MKNKIKIKINEYVRTKNGLIGKVNKVELAGSGVRYAGEFLTDTIIQFDDGKFYEIRVKDKDIANHSFNIIDLIEVGDIVKLDDEFIEYRLIDVFDESIIEGLKQDVKTGVKINSILTKEQYKANCYTVERKE